MIEKTIYQCEHCNKKKLFTVRGMANHEKECWYNTENKTCVTCEFGVLTYDDENKSILKCFKDSKEGTLLESIKPIENCEGWKCLECYEDYNEEIEETELIEPLTNDFIKRVVVEFNKLNYWCSLAFLEDTEILYLMEKETGNLTELVAKDDIEKISLMDNKLDIEFDEDSNGFTGCTISEHGIEY